ncbi:AAA family ATPase [Enterococcus faecalis]|uniref:AAA family ATPase n=1 Tax=Enterococcus faecalis TaxID=1351 RepID=UPI0035CB9730
MQFKSIKFEEENIKMVNPLSPYENVQSHFYYEKDGEIQALSPRGYFTIDLLGLNRKQLLNERERIIKKQVLIPNAIIHSSSMDIMNDFETNFLELWRQLVVIDGVNTAVIDEKEVQITNIENLIYRKRKFINKYKDRDIPILMHSMSIPLHYELEDSIKDLSSFQIESIEIKHFKNISSMKVDITKSKNKIGQWITILGENGSGKTSILQAIALSLVPRKEMLYNAQRIATKEELIHWNVKINSVYHDDISVNLNKDKYQVINYPLIIAYGSTRLSDGIYASKANKIHSIRNLFNPRKSLVNPELFLASLSNSNFLLVTDQIKYVFNHEVSIIRNNQKVIFQTPNGEFSFPHLSDGYKIILSLICDIISTINKKYKSYEGKAIVLIDELENHLHPKWIIDLPQILKKVFPYVQFITTTHNPLLIRQLDSNEVIILSKSEDEHYSNDSYTARSFTNEFPLSSYSIDYLLTTDFFQLYDTNPELNRKIGSLYQKMKTDKDFSFEKYVIFLQENDLNHRYTGNKREYYYQYLLEQILAEEDRKKTTDSISKKIKSLAKNISEKKNKKIFLDTLSNEDNDE